jgi:hypothetical protein
MLEREALEDAPHDGAGLRRLELAGVRAEGAHARRHVAGLGEGRVVRLDEGAERSRLLRQRDELVE